MGSSKEAHVNRNRLIVGLVILVVFMILSISGSVVLLREWNRRQAYVSQRTPLLSLDYCSSRQVKPCVLSFNLDSDGNMLINIRAASSAPPNFYIKVRQEEEESIYKCQRVKGTSTGVACSGRVMPPGEILQFLMLSKDEDILLAEGSFPIIGLALATPEIAPTPTPRIHHYR